MRMKGKSIIAAALASVMMFSLASCANKEQADDGCIYGKISSVDGNDIVIQLAEYSESTDTEAENDTDSKAEDDTSRSGKSGNSNRPQNISMPESFAPSQFSGNLPEGFDGSLPDNFDPSRFGGKMPSGFGRSGSSSQTIKGENGNYTLTGEQKELRIPVGVTVTTSSGVKTGFDALKSGDIIKVKTEKDSDGKDVVTEVWIMEQ